MFMKEKTSITKMVKERLKTHPAVRECILMDIVNYSSLARVLEKELENHGVNASISAVKMALLRTGEELKKERMVFEKNLRKIIGSTVIQLHSDLMVLTMKKNAMLGRFPLFMKIMENARFFQLIQGVDTFTLVISQEEKKRIFPLISKEAVDIVEGQTAIILISPYAIINTPGIVSLITSTLSYQGINITQIISCHKDTIVVVDWDIAPRAYEVLEDLIRSMRK